MAFPTNLVTNEVKDSTGTEVEYLRYSSPGSELVFAKSGEAPNLEDRLTVAHAEISAGVARRRRSKVGFSVDITGNSGVIRTINVYQVADIPVGDISDLTVVTAVVAKLMSVIASKGASTTILYDCSGYGAEALVNGSY